jgi:hypothetical protein
LAAALISRALTGDGRLDASDDHCTGLMGEALQAAKPLRVFIINRRVTRFR